MEEEIFIILKDIQPEFDFETSTDFVEDGYLDSFDVVTLVSELESKFSVSISALEIIPENFSSVKNICDLVKRSTKISSGVEKE